MQNKRDDDSPSFIEAPLIGLYNSVADLGYRIKQRLRPDKLPEDAIILGTGTHPYHRRRKVPVYINSKQRSKHIYAVGGTGSGKTKFLEGIAMQDVGRHNGFGIIDCHGDLVMNDIIGYLSTQPPYSEVDDVDGDFRCDRVVLLDATCQEYSVGFNPLEAMEGIRPYSQALELLGVFKKIWDYWGPRMEELMRNVLVTLAENGLTLIEVQPLLTDDQFRERLVARLANTEAKRYWTDRFNPLSPAMKSQYSEPILNKTQAFLGDPIIRNVIGQRASTINLRRIMDDGKILLVNLSKGTLKENALLLGGLIVAKIQMAAMSRANIHESNRRPWYLYVDEFQNFATESFVEILSEARKYGLSLVMAHQNLDQLNNSLRASILANVATHLYFGVSRSDAEKLASEAADSGKRRIISELTQQKTREAYVRMRGELPMAIKTSYIPATRYDPERLELVKRCAIKAYCRPVEDIEREIDTRSEGFDWLGGIARDDIAPRFAPEVEFEEGE